MSTPFGAFIVRDACRIVLVAAVAGTACSSGVTTTGPIVVDNVVITATVPGTCRNGLACDPISTAYPTLGLITARNNGTAAAYLRTCGSDVAWTQQQFVDGQWQAIGPAVLCAQGPVSIALAPGDSIQTNAWFGPGTWRMALGVAPAADLTGEALDASAGFVVH